MVITGGPSCQPVHPSGGVRPGQCWELGAGSRPACSPRPAGRHFTAQCLPSFCFRFSSHHHEKRTFTFQVKEQSRQVTKSISYCVQIRLSPGSITVLFQGRGNEVAEGDTGQRGQLTVSRLSSQGPGAVLSIRASGYTLQGSCPPVGQGWAMLPARGARPVSPATRAHTGSPGTALQTGIKHLLKIVQKTIKNCKITLLQLLG